MDTLSLGIFPGYLWPIYTICEGVISIGSCSDDLPVRNLSSPKLASGRNRTRRGSRVILSEGRTLHQGDINGQKRVYHINVVDEVAQWEIVASVERISEAYLVLVLESMLVQFPFIIWGFHSDNGSEFVNHIVARLLNKLLVRFTKSRPRHPDDNGLVETKNGSVIRKNLDMLISRKHVPNCSMGITKTT